MSSNTLWKYQHPKTYAGNSGEAKPGFVADNSRRKSADEERHRKYAIIVKLIRESSVPVTTTMAGDAVGVRRHRITDIINKFPDCPFMLESGSIPRNGNRYGARRLVLKSH